MPISYRELLHILSDFEYKKFHQKGSHERWYYKGIFGVTIPHHNELLPKTAKSILNDIAKHQNISVKDLIKKYRIKL